MAIYSPLRSRRLAAQPTEAAQRLITFKLGGENFALPLDRVQKVTTLDLLYADPNGTGVSLTTFQDREVIVIDVANRIFGKPEQMWLPGEHENSPAVSTHPNLNLVRYLLILQPQPVQSRQTEDRLVGLLIDSPPSIQSMPLGTFKPLSDSYNHIHCVSGMSNTIPVNALLRRRVFRIEGTSFVEKQVQTVETESLLTNQPSIFLLDPTSIVRG